MSEVLPEMPVEPSNYDTTLDGVQIQNRGEEAMVDFAPGAQRVSPNDSAEHSGNIMNIVATDSELDGIAIRVIEAYEADVRSRKDWQERMDQALELLGLRNRPLDDLPFEGASAVVYPLIGEACVQFQARAIEELFPSEGPVKTQVIGKKTMVAVAQAERVAEHMNWQMTVQDRSYYWHTDQMMFYLPLAGSCFKKSYYDEYNGMNVSRLVYPGDFAVSYLATSLDTCGRYTHRLYHQRSELQRFFASGFYASVDLPIGTNAKQMGRDESDPQASRDEADDRDAVMDEHDEVYEDLEQHVEWEFKHDQEKYGVNYPLPYVITVQRDTQKVMSIRRNWKEHDELYRKRVWFTHYKYLPGLGFYGFGLLHLMGSLSESTTGALRALLDSAAFANMQGGFASKDAKLQPGETRINPGEYKQVNLTAEELSKAFYTPPFKEPSTALASLLTTLIDAGRRFASTTEEMVGDAPNTGPVGTTIALIEQSSKVFTGIHRRLHVAQGEEFRLRAELNFEFLPAEYPYDVEGAERTVFKSDYDGRVDVIPVSDPKIFSNAQRIAQAQALIELYGQFPDDLERRKVLERFLVAIRVPDWQELLKQNNPKRMDPVTENAMIMMGTPVEAFIEQDHEAHLQVHHIFMNGLNQEAIKTIGPVMQAHFAEHYAMKYYNAVNQQMGGQLPPLGGTGQDEEPMTPEQEQVLSRMAAQLPQMQIMPPSEDGPDQDQQEWEAEQKRLQQAWEADEARKAKAFDSEQSRRDRNTEENINRKDAESLAGMGRDEEMLALERRHAEEMNALKQKQAAIRPKAVA